VSKLGHHAVVPDRVTVGNNIPDQFSMHEAAEHARVVEAVPWDIQVPVEWLLMGAHSQALHSGPGGPGLVNHQVHVFHLHLAAAVGDAYVGQLRLQARNKVHELFMCTIEDNKAIINEPLEQGGEAGAKLNNNNNITACPPMVSIPP
jgi:hypothetical protein